VSRLSVDPPLVLLERGVDGDVAIDRRAALEAMGAWALRPGRVVMPRMVGAWRPPARRTALRAGGEGICSLSCYSRRPKTTPTSTSM
jgi:hypothetical protein